MPTVSGSMRTKCLSTSWNVSGCSETGLAFAIKHSGTASGTDRTDQPGVDRLLRHPERSRGTPNLSRRQEISTSLRACGAELLPVRFFCGRVRFRRRRTRRHGAGANPRDRQTADGSNLTPCQRGSDCSPAPTLLTHFFSARLRPPYSSGSLGSSGSSDLLAMRTVIGRWKNSHASSVRTDSLSVRYLL